MGQSKKEKVGRKEGRKERKKERKKESRNCSGKNDSSHCSVRRIAAAVWNKKNDTAIICHVSFLS
jgi:hypothetical protein